MTRATARLFIALDPPPDVAEQLVAWAREALREAGARGSGPASVRVLDPALLHITLCFLGNRSVEEIATLGELLQSCASPVGELSIGAPLWLPPRRPRALAVEIHDDREGGLRALHGALLEELARTCGFREREHRRFRAHVTLARISERRARRGSERSAGSQRELPATPALSFTPAEIVLYRSWLSPAGASYEALAAQAI
jgi:2'-5' RNA ligase